MLYGVDVSEFQGQINWDQLNAVANFVLIRASFGTERKDNQFDRNQSEARRVQAAAGPLGIGYYYFAYPTLLDPVTSANYFIDNLGPLQAGEVLALDLEGNVGNDPVAWALGWLDQVEARTGVKALLYINQSLMNSYNWSLVIKEGFGLWLADYDGNKSGPGVNTPWPVTALRQWTDADTVAGIIGKVDGDVAYMDFNGWNAYGYHPAVSTPASIPTTTTPPAPVTPPVVTPPAQPLPPIPPAPTQTASSKLDSLSSSASPSPQLKVNNTPKPAPATVQQSLIQRLIKWLKSLRTHKS